MAVPKYDELMKPVLKAIQDGNIWSLKMLNLKLAEQLELDPRDLTETLASGRETVFHNRVAWAKTYLKKAGLIESPKRATVQITEIGRMVLRENPEKIDAKYLLRFPSFSKFVQVSSIAGNTVKTPCASKVEHNPSATTSIHDSSIANNQPTGLTPDDQLEKAYKEINDDLADELLNELMKVNPYTFEKMVVDLLSHMGYGTIEYGSHATAASGDDGIDGIIMEDKLGFSLIYIQVKRWALDQTVGQREIQSFVGAITGKHGDGLFVTTTSFTSKARSFAQTHHIILIDGERLARLMIEYNFCVSVRKTLLIKNIDTDALAEYQDT
ncbi:MAG: restriction endonuclease [Oscillospiraceae bacterium]|nr:restriction endonuclease [Oscillospiraceae bacterium]MDD4368163.1 restriction endonuclease [Oscillospiraceae bacterium]